MCGIFGIVDGNANVVPDVIHGLTMLEYRGYDSSGIAVVNNGVIETYKAVGMVTELNSKVLGVKSNIAIGHTRWATHGEPSIKNCHPIGNDNITIVHNGIIDNYLQLKSELKDWQFITDTDTEIFIALMTSLMKRGYNIIDAVAQVSARCAGTYSFVLISSDEPEKIYGLMHGAPLIIGISKKRKYLSSDTYALSYFAEDVIDLSQDECAIISPRTVDILRITGDKSYQTIKRDIRKVAFVGSSEKGNYDFFMQKEIFEQPDALFRCLEHNYRYMNPEIDWTSVRRIKFIGCGTSRYAAEVAKYWFEEFTDKIVEVEIASEFTYKRPKIFHDDLHIFISQSGETADTLAALRYVKEHGINANNHRKITTIAIVNSVWSTIAKGCDYIIPIMAGPEIGVASTKAFTANLIALYLLLRCISNDQGLADYDAFMVMIAAFRTSLCNDDIIAEISKNLVNAKNIVFAGRNVMYPIATEAGLKMKELTYRTVEAVAGGELKHGPLAIVDHDTYVIVFAQDGELLSKILSNVQEIIARNGKVVLITDAAENVLPTGVWKILNVPAVHPSLKPILYSLSAQLLAYHCAVMIGSNVDRPRNLAKSVTVE